MIKKYPVLSGPLFLAGILIVELFVYSLTSSSNATQVSAEYESKITAQALDQEKVQAALIEARDLAKYAATGKDVYDRIYNTKQRDVNVLLEKLAVEAFPRGWTANVKMEEFTKSLLILQPEIGQHEIDVAKTIRFLLPILKHSRRYLGNVAVYNTKHQCRLFLDEALLDELRSSGKLSEDSLLQAHHKASSFPRYDAAEIPLEESHGHFLIRVVVSGAKGARVEVVMLLDTGASITMISKTLAKETGAENLAEMPERVFETANGSRPYPMVERKIGVRPFQNIQRVAVSGDDDTNLLGVDFFEGRNYIIDAPSKRIYVWAK